MSDSVFQSAIIVGGGSIAMSTSVEMLAGEEIDIKLALGAERHLRVAHPENEACR